MQDGNGGKGDARDHTEAQPTLSPRHNTGMESEDENDEEDEGDTGKEKDEDNEIEEEKGGESKEKEGAEAVVEDDTRKCPTAQQVMPGA